MATVTAGTSASFIVAAGDQLFVTATGSAVVESLIAPAGNAAIRQVVTGQTVTLGPFSSDATFKVTATTGDARYANDVRYASDGTAIGNDGPFDGDGRADGSQWNAGGVVYVKRGGVYQAPTQAQATEFRRAFNVAAIPSPPPARWRLPVLAAVDSGADAALVSALVGSELSLARPFYNVASGATRTITLQVGAIAAPGGLLSFAVDGPFTATVEQSFDSTNGANGAWESVTFEQVFPAGGSSSTGVGSKRQPCRLAAGPSRWVRLSVTAVSAARNVQPLLHQRQTTNQDCWVVIGASLEAYGMRSVDAEAAVISAFPGRDPVVFCHCVGGTTASQIAAHAADAMTRLGDLFRYVIVGNVLGNDITAAQPIPDDSEASLAALRSTYASILGAFPGKPVFPCLHTYRAYSGVAPATPDNGSLPYNRQVVEPVIRDLLPSSIPVVDMYAAAQFNRAILSDNVHFTFLPGGYAWARAEWAATAFAAAYGFPVSTFAERLVAAAERGQASAAEAQHAVSSLSPSTLKDALSQRVTALIAASTVRIGFGSTTAVAGWNKTNAVSVGSAIADLLSAGGGTTGWALSIVNAGSINSAGNGSRGVPLSFPFPPEISRDSLADTSNEIAVQISGLPTGAYRVRVYASRADIERRIVDYTVNGVTRSINVANNASEIAEFENIAVSGGTIDITAARGVGNSSAVYISGIIIDRLV